MMLKKNVTYDVAKMLQGQAPGVQVKSNGTLGGTVDIKIRGITSFRNSNPYICDRWCNYRCS
ncbi:MAG TPA: hypothetical protein EYO76_06015 [Flavobacteriaceae bacterium]|nr:hypothetical protein [Flavobacteriaceae bacterium]